jgi:hypothetical protein
MTTKQVRQLLLAGLVGATVFLWLVAGVLVAQTWQEHRTGLSSTTLTGAAVLSIVTAQLVIASATQTVEGRRHREVLAALEAKRELEVAHHREAIEAYATLARQIQQIDHRIGDGRWLGWAEATAEAEEASAAAGGSEWPGDGATVLPFHQTRR